MMISIVDMFLRGDGGRLLKARCPFRVGTVGVDYREVGKSEGISRYSSCMHKYKYYTAYSSQICY